MSNNAGAGGVKQKKIKSSTAGIVAQRNIPCFSSQDNSNKNKILYTNEDSFGKMMKDMDDKDANISNPKRDESINKSEHS